MRRVSASRFAASATAVAAVIVACGGKISVQPCDDCAPDVNVMPPIFDARPPPFDAKPPPPKPDAPFTGMCPTPLDVSNYVPPPYVPPHPVTNECTSVQVKDFYDNCFNPNTASSQKCAMFTQANMACASCIQSARSDAQWGAIVIGNGLVTLDVAGCVHLNGDVPCAKALEARDACTWAACDLQCPIVDTQSFQAWTKCAQTSLAGGCKKYSDAVEMTCSKSMGSAFSVCSNFQDFATGVLKFGTLFCSGGG